MYARITPYRMKPGSKAAASKVAESLREKIMALPGQKMFLNVINDDAGTGYIVSTTDIADMPDDVQAKVQALWSNFTDFLLDEPKPQTFEVVQHWTN